MYVEQDLRAEVGAGEAVADVEEAVTTRQIEETMVVDLTPDLILDRNVKIMQVGMKVDALHLLKELRR
jgi:hypothetical protein